MDETREQESYNMFVYFKNAAALYFSLLHDYSTKNFIAAFIIGPSLMTTAFPLLLH